MYIIYFLKNLKVRFTYRFDVIFGMAASFCIFFTKIIVWKALYMGQDSISGVSLDETILYAIVSSIVSALMATQIGNTIGNSVYRGRMMENRMEKSRSCGNCGKDRRRHSVYDRRKPQRCLWQI